MPSGCILCIGDVDFALLTDSRLSCCHRIRNRADVRSLVAAALAVPVVRCGSWALICGEADTDGQGLLQTPSSKGRVIEGQLLCHLPHHLAFLRLRLIGPGVDAAEFVDAGVAQFS